MVSSIATDPNWAARRAEADGHRLRTATLIPLCSGTGKLIGGAGDLLP